MDTDALSVLVVDRHLTHLQSRLGDPCEGFERCADGLLRGRLPAEPLQRLLADLKGQQPPWQRPAIMRDLPMRAAFAEDPEPVDVRGTPMDYHGQGAPIAAVRRLAPRPEDRTVGEGVLVGVVDTGMRAHPWLDGGYLASPADFEPYDEKSLADDGAAAGEVARRQAGHGTFITGLVLQQAPGAGVWVERALDLEGTGLASAVATAALTLARRGVHVLNLSLGCFDDEPGALPVMERLLEQLRAVNPRLVVVASAGNLGGKDAPEEPASFWPAALPGVVAVGSVEPAEDGYDWAPWSNRGPWIDLAAPGTRLLSTYLYDGRAWSRDGRAEDPAAQDPQAFRGWARWSGTSFSAAVVSGAIAAGMTQRSEPAAVAVERLRGGATTTPPQQDVPAVAVVQPVRWQQLDDAQPAGQAGTASASA